MAISAEGAQREQITVQEALAVVPERDAPFGPMDGRFASSAVARLGPAVNRNLQRGFVRYEPNPH